MKREVYESQKAFAGEKIPSMLRRCVGHDYTERMMYMVTMVVEGRLPLFGTVVGRSDAPADSELAPRIELSELGWRVSEEILSTPAHHPEISVVALQMMPDHLHAILFVKEKMEEPLGMALRGFKQKCNQHYRELVLGVSSVALAKQQTGQAQQTGQPTQKKDRSRRLTDEQITEQQERWLQQARSGAVLVSPCISKGEKQVMRAAFEQGLPIIVLQENGFTDLAKPGGKRMEACARGQLLLLALWEHHNEHFTFVETLPWTSKRNPRLFNGKFISVTRRPDGSLRLNFKPIKIGDDFSLDRFALGVYNEICMALECLVEE
jgi:hypothetical protein